jgi:hypothetical protein
MVVVIVVLGLSIPVLLNVFADVAYRSAYTEAISDAALYAGDLMERIKSSPLTNDTDFAAIITNCNVSETSSRPWPLGYTRTATAGYVVLSGATWAVSAGATDYIRVVVTVSHSRLINKVSLSTIIVRPYSG